MISKDLTMSLAGNSMPALDTRWYNGNIPTPGHYAGLKNLRLCLQIGFFWSFCVTFLWEGIVGL